MNKIQETTTKIAIVFSLICFLTQPTEAFLWWGNKTTNQEIQNKTVVVCDTLPFTSEDFSLDNKIVSITLQTLPQDQFGILLLNNTPTYSNQIIPVSEVENITFQAKSTLGSTNFTYIPTLKDGTATSPLSLTFNIIDYPNSPPIAENMELFTYKNIEISCYFDISDPESDFMTFQIIDPPARGSVTLSDNGASSFLYTPYENKVGKDQFTYVAIDSSGNTSNEAEVKIEIKKAETPVNFYSDMNGNPYHKSAISLAESGIYVGERMGNTYLFHPDETVSREEFLSLAMSVTDLSPLPDITTTGFYDDEAIATWSKGYVSSALLAGIIQGTNDENGKPVFNGSSNITLAEASVILDNLLDTTTVSTASSHHWASQASANLDAVGVSVSTSQPLPASLNRGEVAELLDATLALFKARDDNWLTW